MLLLVASAIAAPAGLAKQPDLDDRPRRRRRRDARSRSSRRSWIPHKLTSVQLTQFYLHRIQKLNPALNAVITTSPTALADARAADKARRQGDDRPLLGIPIIVKDNINTTGMPTTAGSWALAGSSPSDAFIVQRLKRRRRDRHRQGQPVRVGELPVQSLHPAAGVASAARRTWPTCSTATPVARARGPASSRLPTSPWPQSGRKPMARSSAPPARTASSASSRPSASSAARGSSRSRPTRTRPARWPGT